MVPKESILIPYRRGSIWGYYSPEKKEVLYCRFSRTEPFMRGYANVQIGWKWGLIDSQGNLIIPCKYAHRIGPYSEGLFNINNNDKWGFVNAKAEVVIPFMYEAASPFCEGLARVRKNKMFGFINKSNEEVVDFIYDNVHSFKNGLSSVRIGNLWGAIDKKGAIVYPIEQNSLEELDLKVKRGDTQLKIWKDL